MCAGRSSGWVVGLLIQPACTLQTDVLAAPRAVCVLEKPRPDAATWCPTRLPLGCGGHAPVAIA